MVLINKFPHRPQTSSDRRERTMKIRMVFALLISFLCICSCSSPKAGVCSDWTDCLGGQYCLGGRCEIVECRKNADCRGDKKLKTLTRSGLRLSNQQLTLTINPDQWTARSAIHYFSFIVQTPSQSSGGSWLIQWLQRWMCNDAALSLRLSFFTRANSAMARSKSRSR